MQAVAGCVSFFDLECLSVHFLSWSGSICLKSDPKCTLQLLLASYAGMNKQGTPKYALFWLWAFTDYESQDVKPQTDNVL